VLVPDDFTHLFEEDPLADDACPLCHGELSKQDSGTWCASCELRFAP
jgi:hypothetical protein